VLKHDLRGRALDVPVIYPGSIERTLFAERDEEKGYFILELEGGTSAGGVVRRQELRRLPTRPMAVQELDANAMGREGLENAVRRTIAQLPEDAVVQLRILGSVQQDARQVLGANYLRSLAPPTMNVEARLVSVSRET
jgi:DNA repair exonuclease SbcCD nuclease subunit